MLYFLPNGKGVCENDRKSKAARTEKIPGSDVSGEIIEDRHLEIDRLVHHPLVILQDGNLVILFSQHSSKKHVAGMDGIELGARRVLQYIRLEQMDPTHQPLTDAIIDPIIAHLLHAPDGMLLIHAAHTPHPHALIQEPQDPGPQKLHECIIVQDIHFCLGDCNPLQKIPEQLGRVNGFGHKGCTLDEAVLFVAEDVVRIQDGVKHSLPTLLRDQIFKSL
jgi:hypothetical protein